MIKRDTKTGSCPAADAPDKAGFGAAGIAELRAFLLEMVQRGDGEEAIDLVIHLIARLRDDNNAKAIRIAKLLRERFGRTGERLGREQLDLFLQSVDADDKAGEDAGDGQPELPAAPEPTRPARKRTGRNPLPGHPRSTASGATLRRCVGSLPAADTSTPQSLASLRLDLHPESAAGTNSGGRSWAPAAPRQRHRGARR